MLFHHFGFQETLYYTVIFGVSRGLGALAQLIWDRALGLPIERPRSISLTDLKAQLVSRMERNSEGISKLPIRRVEGPHPKVTRPLMLLNVHS